MTRKKQALLEAAGAVCLVVGFGALGYAIAGLWLLVAFAGIVAGIALILVGNV